jgi:hypothetical protein
MIVDKTEYIKNLRIFESTLDFAIEVSDKTSGIFVPPRIVEANQLFTRLTVTSVSIIHLLPYNKIFPSNWRFWDFFSIATLTRNLIDNYLMFYYVGVEKLSDEEIDFRLKVLTFHLNNEKYKLFSELKVDKTVLQDFEKNLPKAKDDLKGHSFFNSLSKEQAGKILTGKAAMYLSHKEISTRVQFNNEEFMSLYRLFSNHLHSTPFACSTMSNERGRGEENEAEISYLTITLDTCIKYLSAAALEMVELIPVCKERINQAKFKIINDKFQDYLK